LRKVVLLLAILLIPGIAYLILQTGKNNYQTLEIFGPKEPVPNSAKPDTIYHHIADFSFISQDSSIVTQETVKNKIYVADFFFSTCKSICPKMTNHLMRVQNAFKDEADVVIISHTVDPENDTPPVLAKYAEKHKAIVGKWFFVTGDKKQLYDLARNSYYITAMPGDGTGDDFIHSEKMVLIDKDKRIRGFYDGTDYFEITRLIEEVKVLQYEYSKK